MPPRRRIEDTAALANVGQIVQEFNYQIVTLRKELKQRDEILVSLFQKIIHDNERERRELFEAIRANGQETQQLPAAFDALLQDIKYYFDAIDTNVCGVLNRIQDEAEQLAEPVHIQRTQRQQREQAA